MHEILRQENILRNKLFLRSIGLDKDKDLNTAVSKCRKTSQNLCVSPRRSLRNNSVDISYVDVGPERKRKKGDPKPLIEVDKLDPKNKLMVSKSNKAVQKPLIEVVASDPNIDRGRVVVSLSCKDTCAQIEPFLAVKSLGCPLSEFGKVAVIAQACTDASGKVLLPKFNKFSGILQWQNCLFLWINIERKYSDSLEGVSRSNCSLYDNKFEVISDSNCNLTWFGNSLMDMDSVLTKLILQNMKDLNAPKILLFVRIVGENYAPFGLVKCLKYEAVTNSHSEQLLKFTFALVSYGSIHKMPYVRNILVENLAIEP